MIDINKEAFFSLFASITLICFPASVVLLVLWTLFGEIGYLFASLAGFVIYAVLFAVIFVPYCRSERLVRRDRKNTGEYTRRVKELIESCGGVFVSFEYYPEAFGNMVARFSDKNGEEHSAVLDRDVISDGTKDVYVYKDSTTEDRFTVFLKTLETILDQ